MNRLTLAAVLLVLVLASPASAVKIAFCEYSSSPSTGCSTSEPLDLGDVMEFDGALFHTYVWVDENEAETDNVCAIRIVGRSANTFGYAEVVGPMMSYGYMYSEIDLAWSSIFNPAEHTFDNYILFSQFVLWTIAEEHAGEWVEIFPGVKSIGLDPHSYDFCTPPHKLSFAVDYTQSGAAYSLVDDVWSCGGLEGGNPMPLRTPEDAENVVLDIPLEYVTDLSFTYHPDKDGDGITNVDDNCLNESNPHQINSDASEEDRFGNMCDPDYNNDGHVDAADYIMLIGAWGCVEGEGCYDPDLDMEYGMVPPVIGTGVIGGSEYVLLVGLYGKDMDGTVACERAPSE